MDTRRRDFIFFSCATALWHGCRFIDSFGWPELRFGVVSDIHITTRASCRALERALRYFKARGVDAVVIPGDLTDWGLKSGLVYLKETWDEVFGDTDVRPLFCTGNHDFKGWTYDDMAMEMRVNGYSSAEPYSTNLFHGGRRQFGMRMLFKSKRDGSDIELYHGPFGVITGAGGWGTVFYGTKGIVAVNRGKLAVWKTNGLVKPTFEIRKQLENMTFAGGTVVAASVGKDYGTDAAAKKDNALEQAIDKLVATFGLDTAPVQLYKSENQVKNFCECIETRKSTISPASVGGRSGTLCLLCNMSYVYDTGFDWDPVKMDFAGCTAKELPIARADYRGWDIVV